MKTEVQKCPFCEQECNSVKLDGGDVIKFFCQGASCIESEFSLAFLERMNKAGYIKKLALEIVKFHSRHKGYCEFDIRNGNLFSDWIPSH